jgi:enamine deaminase RidA (YjgF/YER057c/UK114 family)
MGNEYIQPPELFESQPFGFTQVVKSPPGRLLSIAGQGAFDIEFKIVGGSDLAAQAKQALQNLGHALRAGGATISDLTNLRIYIVDYKPESIMQVGGVLAEFLADAPRPAQTLLGVQALGMPEMLIEIEATAVVAD